MPNPESKNNAPHSTKRPKKKKEDDIEIIHFKPQKAAYPLPVPPSKHRRSTRIPKRISQPRKHPHQNPHQNHEAKRSNHTPSISTASLPHIKSRWSRVKWMRKVRRHNILLQLHIRQREREFHQDAQRIDLISHIVKTHRAIAILLEVDWRPVGESWVRVRDAAEAVLSTNCIGTVEGNRRIVRAAEASTHHVIIFGFGDILIDAGGPGVGCEDTAW